MTDNGDAWVAGLYLLVLPLAVAAGIVVPFAALTAWAQWVAELQHWVPQTVLGAVLSGAVGCSAYYVTARWVAHGPRAATLHWRRAAPLYVVVGTMIIATVRDPSSIVEPYGYLWPGMVALGGVMGDWLAWRPAHETLAA